MRRNHPALTICLGLCACTASAATAQTTAAATVSFEVREIDEIALSGDPATLVVHQAVAGEPPTAAIDESTTWTFTTNGSDRSVTAHLDSAMPDGLTLDLSLTAPPGATSAGPVALSPTPRTLVDQLADVDADQLPVTYTLSASSKAAVTGPDQRTITFTIVTAA